jgi:hypothetical protein
MIGASAGEEHMEQTGVHRAIRALLVLGVAAGTVLSAAFEGPRLSGAFDVTATRTTPGGVGLTFRFTLENRGDQEITVDRIALANLSDVERAYATFDGGTMPAGGTIRRSGSISVPPSVFEGWQSSGLATLFVYSRNERGELQHTRMVAYRYGGQ